jgi:uncharacterized membrane protein
VSTRLGLSRGTSQGILWALVCSFTLLYFALDWNRWCSYLTTDDFGLLFQSMNDPSGLLTNNVEGSHFTNHFSPIYEFLGPFVQIRHSVVIPIVVQAISGPITAVALYRIAIKKLTPGLALAVSSVALIYPPLAYVIYGDPYETCFAPAVTAWLLLAVMERRWAIAALFVALALSIKEDQALFLAWDALLFIVWATRSRDIPLRNFSLFTLGTALIVGLGYVLYLRPMIAGTSHWAALSNVMHPQDLGASTTQPIMPRLFYLGEVLLPLAFCPLLAPEALLFVIPPIAEVLLAPRQLVWSMGSHYAGVWIGYILIAWCLGICNLSMRNIKLVPKMVVAAFILSVVSVVFLRPAAVSRVIHFHSDAEAQIDAIIASDLPLDVTIGVPDVLYGHLWQNHLAQLGVSRFPCYALLYDKTHEEGYTRRMQADIFSGAYGKYTMEWDRNGLKLYRRLGCGP